MSRVGEMVRLEAMNQQFALGSDEMPTLCFEEGPGGLVIARINNAQATAAIALQGAHLLEWTPQGSYPVIWLSQAAKFAKGKSIRGGIPICWPWFGAHPSEEGFPAHGFARTADWTVVASAELEDGSTQIRLALPKVDQPEALWPEETAVEYVLTIGRTLEMALVTRNGSDHAVTISQALHTYFAVSDIRDIAIDGLDGCDYLDKVEDFARKQQSGDVTFSSEVDRIYLEAAGDCLIKDAGLKRSIRISKTGSASTVVWNPWDEKSRQMGDMGREGYRGMVCVESANAAEDAVTIAPNGEHCLKVRYDVEPF